ncbi:AraC family transcriptional regulator [Paenibacillus allorhizosphaerae]|uniref:HTH-type transcriptional activator RhaS n=1 Tax=Paenibacillus allorhizosphaerae TaxID=2849866 RepID=A0ABM8VFD5_9BACL|nr:AraC family transcriptional regulator [Paenibacillus allorhizosphaerae]CAG7634541.1 HTH-type transcriptional activator RhaS [Paenibacillus allorhizosphaerae]
MSIFPVYQDVVSIANLSKEQLPFFMRHVTVYKRKRLHHHDFAELALIVEGNGTELINGKPHELRPGTITFLLPHHIHELHTTESGPPLQVYNCLFDISLAVGPQSDPELSNLFMNSVEEFPAYTDLSGEAFEKMKRIYLELFHEYSGSSPGRNALIRAKLTEAIVLYIRSRPSFPVPGEKSLQPHPKDHFWEMIQYVHNHYMDDLDSTLLSEQFGVSASWIHRSFKKYLGQGFLQYIHTLRLRRASGLLIATDMGIHDVAVEVGFESYRTFSRIFKEMTGITPSEYRASYAKTMK